MADVILPTAQSLDSKIGGLGPSSFSLSRSAMWPVMQAHMLPGCCCIDSCDFVAETALVIPVVVDCVAGDREMRDCFALSHRETGNTLLLPPSLGRRHPSVITPGQKKALAHGWVSCCFTCLYSTTHRHVFILIRSDHASHSLKVRSSALV